MNVYFMYDKNNEYIIEKIHKLKDFIENRYNTYGIKLLSRITQKTKCDIYVVISDNLEEITKYFEKVENKKKIILLTSKLEDSHILNCINITKNISFLGNKCEVIVDRVISLYEETK